MILEEARKALDRIDTQIAQLFCERLAVIDDIARSKAQTGVPIYHPEREAAVIENLLLQSDSSYEDALRALYERVFEISRERQRRLIASISQDA
ncbi:MAG: chorismate mutase [Clostridiales bacterium]|nr:chorismate mutase [Clostridiales bacterium]